MALTLNSIAGFSDLQNSVLAAEQPAFAIHVSRIVSNAQFGMTRPEFFQALYHDGDTVILPTSPADGYNYTRDELIYAWAIADTGSASNLWLTGPDCLWYINHFIQQWNDTPGADNTDAGKVSCEEWYRKSSVHNPDPAKSNDGILLVTTVAQRQRHNLIVAHKPTYQGDMSSSIGIDKPWQEPLVRKLNVGAKFAVVKSEFLYMSEFVNGLTVPAPISPADGYVYTYPETTFFSAWRWSTQGNLYTQPDNYLGQLQRLQASVSSVGLVSTRVDYKGDLSSVYTTTHGRLAVWALTSRSMAITGIGV